MSTSSSPVMPPIIRVCRKRSADPQTALVVTVKRQRADPLLFSLFTTSAQATINGQSSVVDFSHPSRNGEASSSRQVAVEMAVESPLSFAADAVNEVGGAPLPPSNNRRRPADDDDVITLNGVALQAQQADSADLVFDFYRISSAMPEDINLSQFGAGDFDIRFATKEDRELLFDYCDSESDACDDDADSNAENDWRNDYPDEDEGEAFGEYSDDDNYDGYGGSNSIGNRLESLDLREAEYDSDDADYQ